MRTNVLIVEDDPEMAEILTGSIEEAGGFKCVGVHPDARSALRAINESEPDLVLLDVRMKGMSGVECLRILKSEKPGVKVLMVSGVIEPTIVADCFRIGADGYLAKPFLLPELIESVRLVMAGGIPISKTVSKVLTPEEQDSEPSDSKGLTLREVEIMRCLRRRLPDKEIANTLNIELGTVHQHLHHIFVKLEAHSRDDAVEKFFE